MGRVYVTEFVTLDGVVEDPDGTLQAPGGGWAFRHAPDIFAGDKFETAALLDGGALLLGRGTWEMFAQRWPSRTTPFATVMNKTTKLVASRTLTSVEAWDNSELLTGDLAAEVSRIAGERDIVVVGSASVVHQLAAAGLVDEYRMLVLPSVLGVGRRLFADGTPPVDLRLVSVKPAGPGSLAVYERAA
jgi:dihydrofolate reductase